MTIATTLEKPLIVQGSGELLLEIASPGADDARDALLAFAELVRSPEHVHTFRLTPLSLWNAAAAGHDASAVLAALERHARFPVPATVAAFVREQSGRWGKLRLERRQGSLVLVAVDDFLLRDPVAREKLRDVLTPLDEGGGQAPALRRQEPARAPAPDHRELLFAIDDARRGDVKQALVALGWPVQDDAGCDDGPPLAVSLRERTQKGEAFTLRPYQLDAVEAACRAGSGTIVLPCGSGKTIVGLAAIARARTRTLIVATGTAAARQWRDELLDKTTLAPQDVCELSSESWARKKSAALGPVTIATYSLLAHKVGDARPHLDRVLKESWGLLVLDEVHLLPEPLFRLAGELQARRRLGLTATLVREDGREGSVFALVGPRRASVPWKALERQGWIAEALCKELRVPLAGEARLAYLQAAARERPTLAAENQEKLTVLERLLERHAGEPTLVLGAYLDQLEQAAALANAPLVSGSSPARERERLFAEFRSGRLKTLVLSRVGNHAIDLPEARVAIQLSGTFGSKQEEAQRLGRILRPKKTGEKAVFYALISQGTVEEDYALKRQLFLIEQGYRYEVRDA